MTRAADFPHNIPTDSLGLLAREPRAKTGEELRQETVYDLIKSIADGLLAREAYDDPRVLESVVYALTVMRNILSRHEVTRPISNAIHDALAVTREEKREEETLAHQDVWVPYPMPSLASGLHLGKLAMSTPFPSHELDVQPPAQAPKVEEWTASLAREYKRGLASLWWYPEWAVSPQGSDYWKDLWTAKTPYPDLPQEARDYIDLIASADGGE